MRFDATFCNQRGAVVANHRAVDYRYEPHGAAPSAEGPTPPASRAGAAPRCVDGQPVRPVSLTLSLQRLTMIAGANRDFAPMHHDPAAARATGAPTAYANLTFVLAMVERALLAAGGNDTRIRRMGPLRLVDLNRATDVVTCRGQVIELDPRRDRAVIEV